MGRALTCILYPFQEEGVERAIQSLINHNCCLLFDEQGLGKTVECLASIAQIPKVKRVLVICPTFAVTEWCRIIDENTSMSYCAIDDYNDLRNRCFINVIGYDRYRIIGDRFPRHRYEVVVCDESQFLGNPTSQQTQIVRAHRYPYVMMTTGTPMMNRPSELWPMLDYCKPGEFGTYEEFCNRYTEYENLRVWIRPRGRPGFQKFIKKAIGTKNKKELRKRLKKYMIRRLKKNVLKDLPEKIHQNIDVELTGKQKLVYEKVRRNLLKKINGKKIDRVSALSKFNLLRQLSCAYKSGDRIYSSKFDAVKEVVRGIVESGNKVFVTTPYIAVAQWLSEELSEFGSVCVSSKTKDCTEAREQFQNNEDTKVYVGTIRKHQGAITLTAANYVIFVGKDLVSKRNEQVEDRCHRIGQKKVVNVINVLAKDTIDERIEEILEVKDRMFNDLFTNGDTSVLSLNMIKKLIQ